MTEPRSRSTLHGPAALALAVAMVAVASVAVAAAPEAQTGRLRVTYLGNEGFLLESGHAKVLIDALYRDGVEGYVVRSDETRQKIEQAEPPFDDVDLVLATHFHADHFDAEAVVTYLRANPKAVFLSTPQAIEALEAVPGVEDVKGRARSAFPREGERFVTRKEGIELQVLNLHHGRGSKVQNLGFLIDLDGVRILHVGDTEANEKDFQANLIRDENVDIAFLPYWYLGDGTRQGVEGSIDPERIVAMHIPPPDDPKGYLVRQGGFEQLVSGIEELYPEAVVFREPMESHQIP